MELLDHVSTLCQLFKVTAQLFSKIVALFFSSRQQYYEDCFYISSYPCYSLFLVITISVEKNCSLHFPDGMRIIYSLPLPIFIWGCVCNIFSSFLGTRHLSDIVAYKYFCRLFFHFFDGIL